MLLTVMGTPLRSAMTEFLMSSSEVIRPRPLTINSCPGLCRNAPGTLVFAFCNARRTSSRLTR